MVKPYTWNEIEGVLSKELKKTKHIMTYGTIGSLNVENDIDTIITKKPKSKSSDFFKEVHDLFDNVDKYLNKKYGARAVRFSLVEHEEEVKYIAGFKENDLAFHVMTYTSLDQMIMHWNDGLTPSERYSGLAVSEKVKNILKECYSCMFGDVDNLFKSNFKNNKKEDAFVSLNNSDRINSHFPKEFLINRMNIFFDYMFRKMLGVKTLQAKNEKEIREIFYKLCDVLDKYEG